MYIPIELVERIIGNIHDKATLKSCSLVCRDWTSISQRHIFDTFALHDKPVRGGHKQDSTAAISTCNRTLQLLSDSPHLIPHFQCVVLKLNTSQLNPFGITEEEDEAEGEEDQDEDGSVLGLVGSEVFATLLRQFTHCKTLHLSPSTKTLWRKLPPSLDSSLRHFITINPLERLALNNWEFSFYAVELFELLGRLTLSLRSLDLIRVHFQASEATEVDPRRRVELKELREFSVTMREVNADRSFGNGVFRGLSMPKLQSLYRPAEALPSVYWQTYPNLLYPFVPTSVSDITLEINAFGFADLTNSPVNAPQFEAYENLRRLRLVVPFFVPPSSPYIVGFFKTFFSQIPATALRHLESIVIALYVPLTVKHKDWEDDTWAAMAAALQPLGDFGVKARLVFRLGSYPREEEPDSVFAENELWKTDRVAAYPAMKDVVKRVRTQCRDLERKGALQILL